jgi:hypothetical protein
LSKFAKCSVVILFVLLFSAFAVALSPNARAQSTDEANVVILVSPDGGGTTDPAPDTYNYANGTVVLLTAKPDAGYKFDHWLIQGGYETTPNQPPSILPPAFVDPNTGQLIQPLPLPPSTSSTFESITAVQNPLIIACGYGYTFSYEAFFVSTAPEERPYAVVVVTEGPGGTTDPVPGTYTFANGSSITLTATPNDGYEFKYWTVSGTGSSGHPEIILDNPLSPECGIGYTYNYQPVFAPSGSTTTSGGVSSDYLYVVIVILAIIAVIGIGAALMYRGRAKSK